MGIVDKLKPEELRLLKEHPDVTDLLRWGYSFRSVVHHMFNLDTVGGGHIDRSKLELFLSDIAKTAPREHRRLRAYDADFPLTFDEWYTRFHPEGSKGIPQQYQQPEWFPYEHFERPWHETESAETLAKEGWITLPEQYDLNLHSR